MTTTQAPTRAAKEKMAEAIADYLTSWMEGMYGPAHVFNEGDAPIIAWEGTYEWAMHFGSEGMAAAELGYYGDPEPEAADLYNQAKDAGMMLEPITGYQLGIYEA